MSQLPQLEPRQDAAGFSLIEVTIVASLVAVLAGGVAHMMMSVGRAQRVADQLGRATAAGHELLDEMRSDLVASTVLFYDDGIGQAYVDLLDQFGDTALTSSRLPVAVEDGIFDLEATPHARTGNSILCARTDWIEDVTTISGETYSIDVYKLVYWSLVEKPKSVRDDAGLTLRRFVSEPLADGEQIDSITNANDRAEVLQHLFELQPNPSTGQEGVELVWTRGADPSQAGTLRHIAPTTWVTVAAPRSGSGDGRWHIGPDRSKTSETMLRAMDIGIATNDAAARYGVGRFGRRDSSGAGFPHGFEVQIVGPSSARRVMIHVSVLVGQLGAAPVGSDQTAVTFVSER